MKTSFSIFALFEEILNYHLPFPYVPHFLLCSYHSLVLSSFLRLTVFPFNLTVMNTNLFIYIYSLYLSIIELTFLDVVLFIYCYVTKYPKP